MFIRIIDVLVRVDHHCRSASRRGDVDAGIVPDGLGAASNEAVDRWSDARCGP